MNAVFADQGAVPFAVEGVGHDLGVVVDERHFVLGGEVANDLVGGFGGFELAAFGGDGVEDWDAFGVEAELDELFEAGLVVGGDFAVGDVVGADHDDGDFRLAGGECLGDGVEEIADAPAGVVAGGGAFAVVACALDDVAPAFVGVFWEAVFFDVGVGIAPAHGLPEGHAEGDGVAELGDVAGCAGEAFVDFFHGFDPLFMLGFVG